MVIRYDPIPLLRLFRTDIQPREVPAPILFRHEVTWKADHLFQILPDHLHLIAEVLQDLYRVGPAHQEGLYLVGPAHPDHRQVHLQDHQEDAEDSLKQS
jgi:hypothetical protein